jgi:hypothetical protein
MNLNNKTTEMKDKKVILSTLWIFATFNYLYADVFTIFFDPTVHKDTITMTEGSVLGFAVLMETAIAMILLSRILKYAANRWANIIVGILHTAAVSWSLSQSPAPYYIFFAVIEITCTLFIIWYALRRRRQESQPERVNS